MSREIQDMLRKARCDYGEAHIEETDTKTIRFIGKELSGINISRDFGGNVRILENNGWAFSTFNNIDNIKDIIPKTAETAREVGSISNFKVKLGQAPAIEDNVELDLRSDPRKASLQEKVDIMKSYADIPLSKSSLIKSVSVLYQEKFKKLIFINSEGSFITQERMELSASIVVTGSKNGKTEIQSRNWSNNNDYQKWLNREDDIKNLTELVIMYLDAKDVKSGIYPVVCGPSQTGLFVHEAFGHLSEADKVYKNDSLRDIMKLGRVFGPKILNITDSGLDTGQRGSLVYDDEGVKTRKTYLVREGVLVGRLHSRQTAGIMNESPTGNARAISYIYPPIVRMRNTSIEAGESSFEDIISTIKLGIYAKRSKGGQTGGEMFTFSPAETYYIRDGKVAEPVRNVTFTGNLFKTLQNIEMIGNDYQISSGNCGKGEQFPLPVSFSGPHIKINSVTVGGSE